MNKIKLRIFEIYVLLLYIICLIFCYLFHIKKDVWLISERGTDARDNGYAFYKYLKQKHPETIVKYIISKDSADRNKINPADIINYGSIQHYIHFITSRFLVSTHIMGCSPEIRLFVRLDMYNLAKTRGKNIFLQHGIIYNEDYTKAQKQRFNIDLFVCGAKPEYDFLTKKSYLKKRVFGLTGLARYDGYMNIKPERYILVMPTWRYSLFNLSESDFRNTNYCRTWNSLINNKQLNSLLKKEKVKLVFYPHHEFQKYIQTFEGKYKNVIIADSKHYDTNELLKKCSMLVTDYSSVFFDVHYMRKPVLYYQFDDEDFRQYHHQTGWYNFRNGFGHRSEKENDAIKYLVKKINDGFNLEKIYKARIKKCFAYNDGKSCERIYDKIVRTENEK